MVPLAGCGLRTRARITPSRLNEVQGSGETTAADSPAVSPETGAKLLNAKARSPASKQEGHQAFGSGGVFPILGITLAHQSLFAKHAHQGAGQDEQAQPTSAH